MVDEREIAGLLADRPDLADGLEAVDGETDEWEFGDVPGTRVTGWTTPDSTVEVRTNVGTPTTRFSTESR
jgi:hypothetical protein